MRRDREAFGGDRKPWIAVAVVLATALSVVVLRRPIPLDEVRYLEVLREMPRQGFFLLHLNGEPYAHKPPMMLWVASALHAAGLPLELALRCIPGLAACGTVLVTASLARTLRAPLAPALQAGFFGPMLATQVLLFDPLLTFGVWLTLLLWVRQRDGLACAAAAFALLAKGPVALIFLVPLAWALAPLRRDGRAKWLRLALVLAIGFAALYGWAEYAGHLGGPEFRRKLLWSQTADRLSDSFAHDEPFYYYLPYVLVGFLPCTLLLLPRRVAAPGSADPIERLPWAVLAIVLVFSCISGKQMQYLLSLSPAMALVFACRLEREGGARRLVRATAAAFLALEAAALVIVFVMRDDLVARYGEYGRALAADPKLLALVIAGSAAALLAAVAMAMPRISIATLSLVFGLAQMFVCAPVHLSFGSVVFPRAIEARIAAEPATPLALHGSQQAGLYNWVTQRDSIADLRTNEDVESWCAKNPGGLLIVEDKLARELEGLHLIVEAHDLCRGAPSTLWRVPR